MNKTYFAASAFALTAALGSIGCDVDVDAPELPEYEKVEDGSMGDIDITPPEITTGTKTIEVPTIGLDIPEEGDTDAGETEVEQGLETDTLVGEDVEDTLENQRDLDVEAEVVE